VSTEEPIRFKDGERIVRVFIGVDTGGTFTDVVLLDDRGRLTFDKALSTPEDPSRGVSAALQNCMEGMERPLSEVLGRVEQFCHGTTVGTNALIQQRGARVGLVTTRGFEDVIIVGRGPMGRNLGIPVSQAMDFIHTERPRPLVPKELIRGVVERVGVDGRIVTPLHEESARAALEELAERGVESLAICLLWSFRNETHERRLGEMARQINSRWIVNLSCEVSPLLGEFERSMTTVVNAFLSPVMSRYTARLQENLAQEGLRRPVQIMKCSGGLTLPEQMKREAAATVNSGPVGGLVAARQLGKILGFDNVITTDMGGTSFDVGVIHRGQFEQEHTPFISQGVPVQIPAVRVVTIGAGGGSIAWSDGRRLHVGPQSAGAQPGPACYGHGGTEPTVTDALVVLGFLDPDYFFGGRKKLDPVAAREAITEKVARPLGLSLMEAAAGIYEIVTAKMSDLIRKVTVESGYDPREFVLFAYGGAGPAHCALFSRPLGVRQIVVPYTASVFSAFGVATSDILYTYAKSEPTPLEEQPGTVEHFERLFQDLEGRAWADVSYAGLSRDEVILSRKIDLRYEGQMHEMTLECSPEAIDSAGIAHLREAFEAVYEGKYGHGTSRKESPIEIITFRLEALRPTCAPELKPAALGPQDASPALKSERRATLRGEREIVCRVYDGERLWPGARVLGPALIERRDTTVFVPEMFSARLDGYRNICLSESHPGGP
jgi:N-methylhydantoinase A